MNKVMFIAMLALLTSFGTQAQLPFGLSNVTATLTANLQAKAKELAANQCKATVIPAIKSALTCANLSTLLQKAGVDLAATCMQQATATLGLNATMAKMVCDVVKAQAPAMCEAKLPALLDAQLPALCDQI